MGTLSFWWAAAGTPYYLGYADALARVTPADISRFISSMIIGKPSILSVRMNQADFDREKESAARRGWTMITKDNAYWWASSEKGGGR